LSLHGGVGVVERVGPYPGGGELVAAEAVGARGRRTDRIPGVARVVHVRGVEIAGRGRCSRCAVIDTAGLDRSPRGVAADHRGVVAAVDGDADNLRRTIDVVTVNVSVSV
jgi:hypothetical protein